MVLADDNFASIVAVNLLARSFLVIYKKLFCVFPLPRHLVSCRLLQREGQYITTRSSLSDT